jgi:AAA ATPase domain
MVEAGFAGEQTIKGKSEPQKVYRLDSIRQGATRFATAVSRGLSAFVGRERELEVLERGLTQARSELRVVDLCADPGLGKSRLLHEFRQRIGRERAFVLSGSCSPDGQQPPFLPFIGARFVCSQHRRGREGHCAKAGDWSDIGWSAFDPKFGPSASFARA